MQPEVPRSLADLTGSILDADEEQVRRAANRSTPAAPKDAHPLDTAVRANLATPTVLWQSAGLASLTATVLAIGAIHAVHAHGVARAASSLVGEVTIGVAVLFFALPLVRVCGGWLPALGWTRPEVKDGEYAIRWFFLQYLARLVTIVVLVSRLPHLRLKDASNTVGLRHSTSVEVAVIAVAAILVAPVVEETVFRGILLRWFMRTMPFGMAAFISSAMFGAFHSYQARTWSGATALGVIMAVFGYLQCVVVRRSGHLLPAVAIHLASNALAIALVFHQLKH